MCVFVFRQTIQIRIIDDEEYEKHENFYIVLEEPRWMKRGISGRVVGVFERESERERSELLL